MTFEAPFTRGLESKGKHTYTHTHTWILSRCARFLQIHPKLLAEETPTLQGLQALQQLFLMGLQELPKGLVMHLHEAVDTSAGNIHTLHHRLHQRPLWKAEGDRDT